MNLAKYKTQAAALHFLERVGECSQAHYDVESGFYAMQNGAKVHWLTVDETGGEWVVSLDLEGEVAP